MNIQQNQHVTLHQIPSFDRTREKAEVPSTQQESDGAFQQTALLQTLRGAFDAEPEIRPGVVEQGRKWASDPNYPPLDILNSIATRFVTEAQRGAK